MVELPDLEALGHQPVAGLFGATEPVLGDLGFVGVDEADQPFQCWPWAGGVAGRRHGPVGVGMVTTVVPWGQPGVSG
jgi:hypothetical protein